jgi:fucose 4-O-acetylase-like acetyltransferase
MKRNETLDALKGVLILLVILGHILHGGTLTSYIEDAIYSFHMPLFLGISGYFLKQELFYSGFASLSKKYFYRLIIPFSFAYLVYCFIKADMLSLLYPHSKSEINFIYSTNWVIFNLLLIYLLLRLANIFSSVRLSYINAIGIASLPIYLWHILPLLVLRPLFEKYTLNGYIDYLLYFAGVGIVIGLIFQLKKTALGKVILFGEKLSRSAGK